jgi:hypothetical protein
MRNLELTTQWSARLAGGLFLLFIGVSMVHYGTVELGLIRGGAAAADFINGNPALFRAGIIIDLTLFFLLLVLAAVLYSILQQFHRWIAFLSVLGIVMEVTVSVVIELSSFASLGLLNNETVTSAFTTSQTIALLELVLRLRSEGYMVVMTFFSISFAGFFYLFMRSAIVPRFLAGAGLVLSICMLVSTGAQIFMPVAPVQMVAQVCAGLVMIQQLVFGGWLLIKGVSLEPVSELNVASA